MKSILKTLVCIGLAAMLVCPTSKAQSMSPSGFFISFHSSSENLIIPMAIGSVFSLSQVGEKSRHSSYGNYSVGEKIGDFLSGTVSNGLAISGYMYHNLAFRENGSKVSFPGRHRYFGTKARDLFGNLQASMKFGWMGAYSPVGIYGRLGFHHQWFPMQLANEYQASDYMIGTFCPGIGIRLAPGNLFDWGISLDSDSAQPILEFGTNYNKKVYYKGPYENVVKADNAIINDGLSYMLSAGIAIGKRIGILIGTEWYPYDLFNKDFSAFSSTRPFENLTSKQYSIFLSFEIGF